MAASALVDCFLVIGTRFLEEAIPPKDSINSKEPNYRTVERARVVEKFCQGLREKKFSSSGLVAEAKAGAFVKKAPVAPSKSSPRKEIKSKKYSDDDDDWLPGRKNSTKKKPKAAAKPVADKAPLKNGKSSSEKEKKEKEVKIKVAKKQKETKIKKKSLKGTTKDGKVKARKKTPKQKADPSAQKDDPKTPSPKKAGKIKTKSSSVKTPSTSVAKTPSSSDATTASSSSVPKTKVSGVSAVAPHRPHYDPSMQKPWSPQYGGPHFYGYPHFPPYFHRPQHYARGGSMPLDPRYNNHPNETNIPDSETSPPTTMSPPHTLGDASLYYPVYADPRIVSPMEPDNIPNATYWKKRIRLDNSKRNDKEIAAFMESYEDCKKYAHEMCKTHKETIVERFPVDDEVENLVRVLRPSKLRKLGVDKVSPMPVFHDSDGM